MQRPLRLFTLTATVATCGAFMGMVPVGAQAANKHATGQHTAAAGAKPGNSQNALSLKTPPGIHEILDVNNEVRLGFRGQYEDFKSQKSSDEPESVATGWMPGLNASVSTMFNMGRLKHIYLSFRDNYVQGRQSHSGGDPAGKSMYNHMNDAFLRVGEGIQVNDSLMLVRYLEFGYQYANRHIEHYGQLAYHNELAGAGLMLEYAATPKLVLTGDISAGATFDATNSVHPVPSRTTEDVEHYRFGTRMTGAASVGADYKLDGPLHIYGDIDYRYRTLAHAVQPSDDFGGDTSFQDVGINVGGAYTF